MSKTKNNVHPGHYKVAGRGRQGEDVIHDRQKTLLAASHAMHEHQAPYAAHVSAYEKELSEAETLELPRKPSPKASRASRVAPATRARASAPRRPAARLTPARKAAGARKRRG
jgi:hypothetical protein